MTINKSVENNTTKLSLIGRLDTSTAPELEAELQEILPSTENLVVDLEQLEYISSAGLRSLLVAHKQMAQKGGMKLSHVTAAVMEVFDITGFTNILDIE